MMNRKRAHSEPSKEERQESNGSDQPDQLSDRRTPEIGSKPHYCTLTHWNAYPKWEADPDVIHPDEIADAREYMVKRLKTFPPPPGFTQACWPPDAARLLHDIDRVDITEAEWVTLTRAGLTRFLRLGKVTKSNDWESLFQLLYDSFKLRHRLEGGPHEDDCYSEAVEDMVMEVSGSLSRLGIARKKARRSR